MFLPLLSTQAMASFKLLDYISKPKISASTLTLTKKFLPSTKTTASFNLLDYSSSKNLDESHTSKDRHGLPTFVSSGENSFRFQFLYENAALDISTAMKPSPEISFLASVGTSSIAFGMKGKYKIDSSCFSMYNAGIHMIEHNYNASIFCQWKRYYKDDCQGKTKIGINVIASSYALGAAADELNKKEENIEEDEELDDDLLC
ncbi:hypothetical protein FEM48_Zijuj09G0135700 [Ziziphus jujuba var. spinosa]|uniref:Uncharacterized protein n=1 Tax=Ziziphus jujuba var. spinosa TaxID=714518 RepID=A0A978UTA9_ZIZJJ|nr:hypothetical protein FEM48_Zijuj09G0135700 [Ziziphus jujuba var. spinosa]